MLGWKYTFQCLIEKLDSLVFRLVFWQWWIQLKQQQHSFSLRQLLVYLFVHVQVSTTKSHIPFHIFRSKITYLFVYFSVWIDKDNRIFDENITLWSIFSIGWNCFHCTQCFNSTNNSTTRKIIKINRVDRSIYLPKTVCFPFNPLHGR